MNNLIAVMTGGAVGALLRYMVTGWVISTFSIRNLPLGTFAVNVIGSFLIGILAFVFLYKINNEWLRLFFIVGLLGSFTTVSSFSLETVNLLMNEEYLKGIFNIIATIVVCIGATWFGYMLTRQMFS